MCHVRVEPLKTVTQTDVYDSGSSNVSQRIIKPLHKQASCFRLFSCFLAVILCLLGDLFFSHLFSHHDLLFVRAFSKWRHVIFSETSLFFFTVILCPLPVIPSLLSVISCFLALSSSFSEWPPTFLQWYHMFSSWPPDHIFYHTNSNLAFSNRDLAYSHVLLLCFQACKNFFDGKKCVAHCPLPRIYDSEKFEYRPNPDVKYAYGPLCVDKCPCEYLHAYTEIHTHAHYNNRADVRRTLTYVGAAADRNGHGLSSYYWQFYVYSAFQGCINSSNGDAELTAHCINGLTSFQRSLWRWARSVWRSAAPEGCRMKTKSARSARDLARKVSVHISL